MKKVTRFLPPKPLFINSINYYKIQEHKFLAIFFCPKWREDACLNSQIGKRGRTHLPQGCARVRVVAMSCLKVGMSCIKARVVATSQNMRAMSPKLNPLINLAILSWDLRPHLESCNPSWWGKFQTPKNLWNGNICLVPLARVLAKMICQVTQLFFGNYPLFF